MQTDAKRTVSPAAPRPSSFDPRQVALRPILSEWFAFVTKQAVLVAISFFIRVLELPFHVPQTCPPASCEECQAASNGIDSAPRGVKVGGTVTLPGHRSHRTFCLCDPTDRSRWSVDRYRPMARAPCEVWQPSRRFGDARSERLDDRANGRQVQPTNGNSGEAARDLHGAADDAKRTGRWLRRPCPRTGPGYWITTVPARVATVVGGLIVVGS